MQADASPPEGPGDTHRDSRDPFRNWSAGSLLMTLLLLSLGILFTASIIGYLIIRFSKDAWPPPGAPKLPTLLWLSTGLIVISSIAVQIALAGARNKLPAMLTGGLVATSLLGIAFLICQIISWLPMIRYYSDAIAAKEPLFVSTFFFLTGLHAAHVIGGLVPALVLTIKALAGGLSPERTEPVGWLTMYWHFLDVVWVVLFLVLWGTN